MRDHEGRGGEGETMDSGVREQLSSNRGEKKRSGQTVDREMEGMSERE